MGTESAIGCLFFSQMLPLADNSEKKSENRSHEKFILAVLEQICTLEKLLWALQTSEEQNEWAREKNKQAAYSRLDAHVLL